MKFTIRLEFAHVFPNENKRDVIEYLKIVSFDSLIKIIGFSNNYPPPNFDNFFTNPTRRNDVIKIVENYCKKSSIANKPIIVSREASLRLAEIILSNRDSLKNNEFQNADIDELNIFKAFLVINEDLNLKQNLLMSTNDFDKIVDIIISIKFSSSDLGLFERNDLEFIKLLYSAMIRFEYLLDFLNSKDDHRYLGNSLCEYFNLNGIEELNYQVKFLFGNLLALKAKGNFIFSISEEHLPFLNSLSNNEIIEDDDYTNLKNYPLYKIDDNSFSIVDYFFAVDKFTKSVRFILKNAYNQKHSLPNSDRSFFSFFNKEFSEDFLMKNVLNEIFNGSTFTKKNVGANIENEPDYYVRYKDRIFLIENKDVMIAKDIKSSNDISKINNGLRSKFYNKNIGIGQLVTSIKQIIEQKFAFDNYVNHNNNLTIYPILVVTDRIFGTPGINYKLNEWFWEKVKTEISDYNQNYIKDLTLIDIDTLIYWLPYLKRKGKNFRKIIDNHLNRMTESFRYNYKNDEQIRKFISKKVCPISGRFTYYKFSIKLFMSKLK